VAEAAVQPIAQSTNASAGKPDAAAPVEPAGTNSGSTLQLSSSSRLGREHQLLREAYTAYQAGDDQLALQKYNQALEIDPGNRNALLARAAINVQNNDAGAAIADYRQLLLANPKDSLAMTSLITVANVSPVDAETRLKLMIREEPDSPYLNFALANAYGAQDRWREAQNHYFTALENNPGDPNYAYNLAVSLEHIAKPEVAVSYYRRALDNMKNGLAMFSKEVVDQRLEILGKL
jgi:tetratricopeptide (TPR) repeat protein